MASMCICCVSSASVLTLVSVTHRAHAAVCPVAGYGFAYDHDACVSEADCAKPGAHKANAFIGTGPTNFALSGVKDYGDGGRWIVMSWTSPRAGACHGSPMQRSCSSSNLSPFRAEGGA